MLKYMYGIVFIIIVKFLKMINIILPFVVCIYVVFLTYLDMRFNCYDILAAKAIVYFLAWVL